MGRREENVSFPSLSQGRRAHRSLHLFLTDVSKSYLAFLHWFVKPLFSPDLGHLIITESLSKEAK